MRMLVRVHAKYLRWNRLFSMYNHDAITLLCKSHDFFSSAGRCFLPRMANKHSFLFATYPHVITLLMGYL